jgi:hypothetical protein
MDGQRFDRLVKALGTAPSRRHLLKAMAGAATAGVAALLAPAAGRAGAVCRAPGNVCSKQADCCSGCCGPADRTGRRHCLDSATFATDPANCGACGHSCPGTPNGQPICVAGACDLECASAADPCGGACCTIDQFCEADACVACKAVGADCASEFECCSGVCDPYVGQCLCASAADACGGACCTINQICAENSCVACLAGGTACASDAECCSGFCDPYSGQCVSVI